MKKLFSLLIAVLLFSGCTTAPKNTAAIQARKNAIAAVSKVEIFYNDQDELVVVDGGGSSMTGLAGIFGPIGQLMALGVDASSKLSVAERAEARSKEFTAAVNKEVLQQQLHQQFAENLAARIQATGREVKLTPIQRVTGELSGTFPDVQLTPGYTPLFLRITTGYGASDALSSYQPVIVVEQSLKNVDRSNVYFNKYTSNIGEPSYLQYNTLLEQHAAAYKGLQEGLASATDPVFQRMFAVSKE